MSGEADRAEPRWCVVANVKAEIASRPGYRGSKHFRAGARIHIIGGFSGNCADVAVIGRHRGSQRWITLIMRVQHLEAFRAKPIYHPEVLKRLERFSHNGCSMIRDQEDARAWVGHLAHWG